MRGLWLGALLLLGASGAAAQSVRAGIEAWSAGRHAEAVAIWRPLASGGSADAAFNLAQAYKLGRGVPMDLGEAQRFYERAARKNHLEAQTSLGFLLFQTGNRAGALRWLKLAAEGGEPRALLVYGTALFNGDGVPEDRTKAYAYVSRAAAQGLAPARATLEEMDQIIPLEDRKEGVKLAQRMAEGGAQTVAASRAEEAPPAKKVVAGPGGAAPITPAQGGAFRIQLGAFRDRGAATALYTRLGPKLGGAAMTLVPSGTMTRLQVGPYPTRAAASAACGALKPQPCFPVTAK